MNDKCAAGTGRFLEMMARSLEISIDELGPVSLQSKENIEISSMCSVFAESEVISLIAQNKEIADIAHGIHKAIAGKAMSLQHGDDTRILGNTASHHISRIQTDTFQEGHCFPGNCLVNSIELVITALFFILSIL